MASVGLRIMPRKFTIKMAQVKLVGMALARIGLIKLMNYFKSW